MGTVKKTYSLNQADAEKLLSYACRYKGMQTSINETTNTLTVFTTFADNDQPTSIADQFNLIIINESSTEITNKE